MQIRIAAALAALAVAGMAAARLLSPPALAATPWGGAPPAATNDATQPPQTSSVYTTPGTDHANLGDVAGGPTATMFSATNPYSCTIQPVQQDQYSLVITNRWTGYLPERNTWVKLCGPQTTCIAFGQMVAPTDPGATSASTVYPTSSAPLPHGLTTCTATGATQVQVAHGPH
jgi:hypothetical protein